MSRFVCHLSCHVTGVFLVLKPIVMCFRWVVPFNSSNDHIAVVKTIKGHRFNKEFQFRIALTLIAFHWMNDSRLFIKVKNYLLFSHFYSLTVIEKIAKSKLGKPLSEETKNKISKASIGKEISVECRKKLSESLCNFYKKNSHNWVGRKHSPESCAKMASHDRSGSKSPSFGRMWINNGINNKRILDINSIPEGYKKGRLYKRKLIEP